MSYINHLTMTTGHLSRSYREQVGEEAIQLLVPWLHDLVEHGDKRPLPGAAFCHYSAQALVVDGGLVLTVYAPAGPFVHGEPNMGRLAPLVTMAVAQRSRQAAAVWDALKRLPQVRPGLLQPDTPMCAVVLYPPLAAHPDAADWLGDFEQCVAWAWITRNPQLGAAT